MRIEPKIDLYAPKELSKKDSNLGNNTGAIKSEEGISSNKEVGFSKNSQVKLSDAATKISKSPMVSGPTISFTDSINKSQSPFNAENKEKANAMSEGINLNEMNQSINNFIANNILAL